MLFKNKKNIIVIKASILILALIITSCANSTMATLSKSKAEEVADYVIEQLSLDKDNIRIYVYGPLQEGEEIYSVKEHILTIPSEGYILYIDLYPMANFHQVQYAYISEISKELIVIDSEYPPNNFENFQEIETVVGQIIKSGENRRAPIPDDSKSLERNPNDPRWAVLMNGGYNAGNNHIR